MAEKYGHVCEYSEIQPCSLRDRATRSGITIYMLDGMEEADKHQKANIYYYLLPTFILEFRDNMSFQKALFSF